MKRIFFMMLLLSFAVKPVFAADDETSRQVLKDAIAGAVAGAVSSDASKQAETEEPAKKLKQEKEKKNSNKNFTKKNKKEKNRPHGWDMGKKTGWGEGDVPPGQSKKQ